MNRTELPAPADGFTYPMTVEQQLRRMNRIGHVLWVNRERIACDPGRILIDADPDQDRSQIGFHIANGTVASAEQLVRALDGDLSTHEARPYANTVQHYWYGVLDGFRFQVVVVDVTPAVVVRPETLDEMRRVSEGHASGAFDNEQDTTGTCTGCVGQPGADDDHTPGNCPYALALRS